MICLECLEHRTPLSSAVPRQSCCAHKLSTHFQVLMGLARAQRNKWNYKKAKQLSLPYCTTCKPHAMQQYTSSVQVQSTTFWSAVTTMNSIKNTQKMSATHVTFTLEVHKTIRIAFVAGATHWRSLQLQSLSGLMKGHFETLGMKSNHPLQNLAPSVLPLQFYSILLYTCKPITVQRDADKP